MKKIYFILLKPSAVKRARNIKSIGLEKRNRIVEAIAYINEWYDIPVSMLFQPICDRLKIQPDASAKNLVLDLMFPNVDIEAIKKRLP